MRARTRFTGASTIAVAALGLAVAWLQAACGVDVDAVAVSTTQQALAHPTPGRPTSQLRPRGITLEVPWEHARGSGERDSLVQEPARGDIAFAGPGQAPLKIFLNRNGGTYSPGPDNARANTSIVPQTTSTIAPFPLGDAAWQQLVACVTDQFARFNVEIVQTEPTSGEYVEHVVGGRPGDMGLPNGVGGVAPIDNFRCGVIVNAINFTFASVYGGDVQAMCETAAQEIAHSFSLDHEFECTDPMTYLNGCGNKTFQDFAAQCGEFQPRQCNCGRASQNSVQIMLEKLGAAGGTVTPPIDDNVPPQVAIAQPANGATLAQDSTITVVATASDDNGIASTELLWDFTGDVFPCPVNAGGGSIVCTRSGTTSTWNIRVGQGDRTFSVRATDVGGNQVTTQPRTIHLGDAGTGTNDTTAPVVTVLSPDNGATLAGNSTVVVQATATDDQALASVELLWTFTGDTFTCPFSGQAVTCEQAGNTYTWSLNVGVGTRAFQVRAIDLAQNQFVTPERTITLSADGNVPVNPNGDTVGEPNNSAADAFATRCGNAIDLVVSADNEDWFAIAAAADTTIEVGISSTTSATIGLELFDADGTTLLANQADVLQNGGALRATSTGNAVLARVTTTSTTGVTYRISATCSAVGGDAPLPGTDDALEDNDDAGHATESFCPQERQQLIAADHDFFLVKGVRDGDTMTVTLAGEGVTARILDDTGAELAPAGAVASVENLAAGAYYVQVDPTGDAAFYDVKFACAPTSVVAASGCACDATTTNEAVAAPAVVVLLLTLSRLRRGPRAA